MSTEIRRNDMLRSTLTALSIALLANGPANAEELGYGQQITVAGTILCDTHEQMVQIATAQQENFLAGLEVLRLINAQKNEMGEPPCMMVSRPLSVTMIADVEFVERLKFPDGVDRSFYIAAIMWDHKTQPDQPGFIFSMLPVSDEPLKPASFEQDA